MNALKHWKILLGVLLVAVVWRLYWTDLPTTSNVGTPVGAASALSAELPEMKNKRDQRTMRDAVMAGDVWGWPRDTVVNTATAIEETAETSEQVKGWLFAGVFFDGQARNAVLIHEEEGTIQFKVGEQLPSGQTILDIFEDEMLILVDAETLSVLLSRVDADSENSLPSIVLENESANGESEVLVRVGFYFGQ